MALRIIPAIHRATHRIGLQLEGVEDLRVSQAEAHVLAHLASTDAATIGEVHRAFGHKRSTLTSILDRLEERNLIVRTSDARDRRTFVLSLTRSGRAAARQVVDRLQAFEKRVLQGASPGDVRAFLRILERVERQED